MAKMSHMYHFCLSFTGVFTLILSAFKSASICLNMAWNCGLLAIMRLFEARDMSRAWFNRSSSGCVNMSLVSARNCAVFLYQMLRVYATVMLPPRRGPARSADELAAVGRLDATLF